MIRQLIHSLFQDLHHLPAVAWLLLQDQRISRNLLQNPKHQQIQWRLDVSRIHTGSRSRQTLIYKLWKVVIQYTQKTRCTTKIQRKTFLIDYNPSLTNWRNSRRMCSHIPLQERSQIRKVILQKWKKKKQERKHNVYTHFPNDRNYDIN